MLLTTTEKQELDAALFEFELATVEAVEFAKSLPWCPFWDWETAVEARSEAWGACAEAKWEREAELQLSK